jgi:hypothetical protein
VQNLQKLDHGLISKKHRGFFAKFLEILITELFSNGKGRGPGPRIRGPARRTRSTVDRRRRGQRGGRAHSVHRGPTASRTEGGLGAAAPSPKLGLRPLRCTKAHRWGRNRERRARGARLGPHRSSGGGMEAGRRWCRTGGGDGR